MIKELYLPDDFHSPATTIILSLLLYISERIVLYVISSKNDNIKEYLSKKGIKDYSIIKDFDYENQGFRGLDKYLKKKKMKVR